MNDAERHERNERIAEAVEREARYAAGNAEYKEAEYRRVTARDFFRAGNVPRIHAAWAAASAYSARWGDVDLSPTRVRDSLRAEADYCVLLAAEEPDASIVTGLVRAAAKMIEILRWDGGRATPSDAPTPFPETRTSGHRRDAKPEGDRERNRRTGGSA